MYRAIRARMQLFPHWQNTKVWNDTKQQIQDTMTDKQDTKQNIKDSRVPGSQVILGGYDKRYGDKRYRNKSTAGLGQKQIVKQR